MRGEHGLVLDIDPSQPRDKPHLKSTGLRAQRRRWFSAVLGVRGYGEASLAQHALLDVSFNDGFCAGLKSLGAGWQILAFMSAIGANIKATTSGSAPGLPRCHARVQGAAGSGRYWIRVAVGKYFSAAMIIALAAYAALCCLRLCLFSPHFDAASIAPIRTTEIARRASRVRRRPGKSAIY